MPSVVPSVAKAGIVYRDLVGAAEAVLGRSDFIDVLQVSRRGGVALIHHGGGLKVFKFIGCQADWKKRWGRRVGWNPGRTAFKMSKQLSAAGISVCEVEAYGSVSLPGAPRAIWTLSDFEQNGIALRELKQNLQAERVAPHHPHVKEFFDQSLQLLRRIHDAGFEHRDYHAGNILVVEDKALRLFDLETVVQRRATDARRARDVRRFLENFVEPDNYLQIIDAALHTYAPDDKNLQQRILKTRRMRGLLAKKGERKMGHVPGW